MYYFWRKSSNNQKVLNMIPLLVGAAISIGGSAVSSIAQGNAAKKQEDMLNEKRDEAEARYQHQLGTDYLDTDAAKSTLSMLRKQNDKQMEALGNDAVKSGASEEAKVAAASKLNENYAGAAAQLAGYGTQYQQALEDKYLRRVDSLDSALMGVEGQKANAWGAVGAGATQLGGAVMSGYGNGVFGGDGAKGSVPDGFKTALGSASKVPGMAGTLSQGVLGAINTAGL